MAHAYDLFISHASEDKVNFVFPLANLLAKLGVSVWYDEFTLTLGDSLSRSIDKGLANSGYGLVVLSPSFLAKNWPEYELRGLISKEMTGQKVILPIWHQLGHSDILKFSPSLADKFALDTSRLSLDEIAIKIIGVVRRDIFENLLRLQEWQRMLAQAEEKVVPREDIVQGPIVHGTLPKTMLLRIKLVHQILSQVRDIQIEDAIDSFQRDLHPENELPIWENIASAFLEITSTESFSFEEKRRIYGALLRISLMTLDESLNGEDIAFRTYAEIYHSVIPVIYTSE